MENTNSPVSMTLGDYKDKFVVGTKFNYLGFYDNGKPQPSYTYDDNYAYPEIKSCERWEVERVVERGIVVSHPGNKGHQHLLEWTKPLQKIKFA